MPAPRHVVADPNYCCAGAPSEPPRRGRRGVPVVEPLFADASFEPPVSVLVLVLLFTAPVASGVEELDVVEPWVVVP